jgi:hypothetical protein
MTRRNRTRPSLTGLTDPSGLSGPGMADLSVLAGLTGRPALGTVNLSALTGPGLLDLTEPDRPSAVDGHDGVRPGPSFGGPHGASPVREVPSEPPPVNRLTALLSTADRPIPDRGD